MGRWSTPTRIQAESTNDELVDFVARELIGTRLWFVPGECLSRKSLGEPWGVHPYRRDRLIRDAVRERVAIGGLVAETAFLRLLREPVTGRYREMLIRLRDWQRFMKVARPEDLPS